MKKKIQQLIQLAVKSLYGIDFDVEKIRVDYPPDGMGDYATNIAMMLAKEVKESPMEAAEKIKGSTLASARVEPLLMFKKIEVVKPGFINFWLSDRTLQLVVVKINREKSKFGDSDAGQGKKIHMDFVSANPTGPVHIGNARGGPLGDTLANVFEKAGYEPFREYYINDAGNQVEVLGHSILGDKEAQYKGEYIRELSSELKTQNSKLWNGDVRKVGQEGVKIIIEEYIKPSMEKFGIKFDNWFSEKELQKSGKAEEVINTLRERDFVYEKGGALWFKSTRFGDDKDRVVVKSTGEKTYFGSDIAYHKNRLDQGFDRLINVWGADHHGDVVRVKGALEALGYKNKLDVILTQLVRVIKNGREMKMSKRAGTYVSIDDLIDEVGKDATRFFFLMHSADTHMNFDLDLAKERSEKNPVYYVQYAHARICSILRKAEGILPTFNIRNVPTFNVRIHAKEYALMFELLKFPDLVEEIAGSYEVHHLSRYAMDVADKFHSFYDECRVIDEDNLELTAARLELIKAVKIVLAEVLRLMGVSAPEKM